MKHLDTRVQLNDIFQPKSEKLIKERINYAINKEGKGKNFWRHFFLCDTESNCANQCVITYLFTEQQLDVLRTWWDLNTSDANNDKVLKDNLEKSKTDFFEEMKIFKDVSIEPVYACCITKYESKHPAIIRLIFGTSPAEKLPYGCIDFFTNNFNTTIKELSKIRQAEIILGLVLNIRSEIETAINRIKIRRGKIKIKDGIYFLFLGQNYDTHQWLEYCKNINPKCPLL